MARFEYQALTATGDLVNGEADATDSQALLDLLRERALLPIHTAEKRARRAPFGLAASRTGGFRRGDLALFMQQLARLLGASLPLDRALEILGGLTAERRGGREVRRLMDRVRDGASLSEAMAAQAPVFPPMCVSMVRAGEEAGALREVLARVADFLLRAEAARQQAISALTYPAILLAVASVSICLILVVVLPQFEPMLREASDAIPLATRIVMAASEGLRASGWWMLPALAVGMVAAHRALRHPAARLWRDRAVLRLPLLGGLVVRFETGRFCDTLAVLVANGVPAARALGLAAATISNRVLADAVETLAARFREGEGLARALANTGRFPPLATQLIQIGEETGRLDEMLREIAGIFDAEVSRSLTRFLALLVPGITIVMGLVVALILAAVMSALISLNSLAA